LQFYVQSNEFSMIEFVSKSPEDNDFFAESFLKKFPNPSIVLLNGEMGAGKTTLMQSLCRALKAGNVVSSPTFGLVNEYKIPQGVIYHFDLYRLKSVRELVDMGFEEYIDSKQWCFIEWPDLAAQFLPQEWIKVQIAVEGEHRKITVDLVSGWRVG